MPVYRTGLRGLAGVVARWRSVGVCARSVVAEGAVPAAPPHAAEVGHTTAKDRETLRAHQLGPLEHTGPAEGRETLDGVFFTHFEGHEIGILFAVQHLASGDTDTFSRIMAPCQELSRIIFEAPTRHYKAALAMLAYLDGRQSNPMLINHEELARNADHYQRVIFAATKAGVFTDAATAAQRVSDWATKSLPR